jgi:formate-dependent nitrite reductase cytochrome c552 subunit
MTCHAPLSEQLPALPRSAAGGETSYEKNLHLDQHLQLRGITCAACHVRQHRRFGPPKADGAAATQYPSRMPNHGGAERTPYFEKAEFCKDCHQFDPESSLLINGKPLQDTYREWKNSIWGKGDAACQDCHMPQWRHLWRGIHDREWVRGGIQFKVNVEQPYARAKEKIIVTVEVTNSAVGHKFPSYITPKVFLRASLLDSSGKTCRER